MLRIMFGFKRKLGVGKEISLANETFGNNSSAKRSDFVKKRCL